VKNAQQLLGSCIRAVREQRGLTLENLAEKVGISYQYLSGVENGKENFTIQVLENVAQALKFPLKSLVSHAYETAEHIAAPRVNPNYFRDIPLPPGLNNKQLEAALNRTQAIFHLIDRSMRLEVDRPLCQFIQGNNFSGLVSNILSDAMDATTLYKHNHHQKYPDLYYRPVDSAAVGLEVKATIRVGKGGESHNGHSGWHMVACYKITSTGIQFLHIMFAVLNGHKTAEPDWKYSGSVVNEETGSQRTETYVTTAWGTTKLRDGSAYIDPNVNFARWRRQRRENSECPDHSIFYASSPSFPLKKTKPKRQSKTSE